MTRIALLLAIFVVGMACGAPQASSSTSEEVLTPTSPTPTPTAPKEYRHSPILNSIMKNEVNKPFSKLTFFVFHSDGEFDFKEIEKTTNEFAAGVTKARAFPNPPVESEQGREVFATFLEHLDRDSTQLTGAVMRRDSREMRVVLGRLSRTCNKCHHFFRLDIADSPEQ